MALQCWVKAGNKVQQLRVQAKIWREEIQLIGDTSGARQEKFIRVAEAYLQSAVEGQLRGPADALVPEGLRLTGAAAKEVDLIALQAANALVQAGALQEAAEICEVLGRHEDAAKCLFKAAAQCAEKTAESKLLLRAARCLLQVGRPKETVKAFKTFVRLNAFDDAIAAVDVMQSSPNNLLRLLAMRQRKQGNMERMMEALRRMRPVAGGGRQVRLAAAFRRDLWRRAWQPSRDMRWRPATVRDG